MGRNAYLIGIDEAGRGPLAGPIVIGAVKMSPQLSRSFLRGIRDSKKLSAKKREEWFRRLTEHPKIEWAAARVSPEVIDRINIYHAAQRGAANVYCKLAPRKDCHALLDGSLHLPADVSHETIIRGDELVPIISAASIIAKVTRDRIMLRTHKKYPQYRLDLHKGYSTRLHRQVLREHGPCPAHRRSFRWG